MVPFGQDLKAVVGGLGHDHKDLLYVAVGDRLMKQIRHGVDEDGVRPPPVQRLGQVLRPPRRVEALRVGMPRHAAPAFGEP